MTIHDDDFVDIEWETCKYGGRLRASLRVGIMTDTSGQGGGVPV
jgi:hypothetical protein